MTGILQASPEDITQLQPVDLQERFKSVLAHHMLHPDVVSGVADRKLHAVGAKEYVLSQLSSRMRRRWMDEVVHFDAVSLDLPDTLGNTYLALTARRDSRTTQPARLGYYSVVGYRVNGDHHWVQTVGQASEQIAYTVNAMDAYRESLATPYVAPQTIAIAE